MGSTAHENAGGSRDTRNEIINSIEKPVPPIDGLIREFSDKRSDIENRLRDLRMQSGVTLDALQIRERRQAIRQRQTELDELNSLWNELGGDAIDDARQTIDELNFRSDATDRVHARASMNDAKSVFYNNFLALHEKATHHSGEGDLLGDPYNPTPEEMAQAEAILSGADTLDPMNPTHEEMAAAEEFLANHSGLSPEQKARQDELLAKDTLTDVEEQELRSLTAQSKQERQKAAEQESEDDTPSMTEYFQSKMREEIEQQHHDANDSLERKIRETVGGAEAYEAYEKTLAEYGEARADNDIHDGRIHRRKREENLRIATEKLVNAHVAYAMILDEARKDAGIYDKYDDEKTAKQARSDDFFDNLRRLGPESAQAATKVREQEQKDRNIFKRGFVAVGRFLSGGKSKKNQWMRSAGSGAGAGAAVAVGTTLSGVGWPVTTAVGIGTGFAVRYGTKMAALDKALKQPLDVTETTQARDVFDAATAHSTDNETIAKRVSQEVLGEINEASDRTSREAREKAKAVAGRTMLGFAIGGGVVHGIDYLSNHPIGGDVVHATDTPSSGDEASSSAGGNHDLPGSDQSGTDASGAGESHGSGAGTSDTYEFPHGTLDITPGEGFYHQFHDMGFSQSQAEALYQNDSLMKGLEKLGVAYQDESVGGWGINMPANGLLKQSAAELIRQHADQMGFIK